MADAINVGTIGTVTVNGVTSKVLVTPQGMIFTKDQVQRLADRASSQATAYSAVLDQMNS